MRGRINFNFLSFYNTILLNDLGTLYTHVHWKRYIYSRMYLTPSERQDLSRSSLYLYMRETFWYRHKNYGTPDVFFLHSLQPSVLPSFLPISTSFLKPRVRVLQLQLLCTYLQRPSVKGKRWRTTSTQDSIRNAVFIYLLQH